MCEHIKREGDENRYLNTDVKCATKLWKILIFMLLYIIVI